MEMKFAQVVNKGMQRDYAMNTASQEFAYENKNIRITTTGDESFLAVTNEKSTVYNSVLMTHLQTYEYILDYKYNENNTRVEDLTITFNFYDGTAEKEEPLKKDTTFRIYDNYEGSKMYEEIIVPKGVTTFTITGWDIQNLQFGKGVEVVQIDNKELYNIADDVPVNMGTILGVTTIGEYVVVFSKYEDSSEDVIYRLKEFDAEVWLAETVFRGNLNFDIKHPIECTTSYESDDVQKVYWVDGINQPRIINICELGQSNYTTNLDFVPKIEGDIKVEINKKYDGSGSFPSGVIQYYITYYNKFGQESNAVYTSPLHMISSEKYGGNEDETQDCSFELLISNVNIKYDYIRVYSFIRTSINGTPSVSIVGDLNIQKDRKDYIYRIVDTNAISNIPVPASDILFLGGNTIVASTIEQKDNTLFLGNITTKSNEDDYNELKQQLEIERNSNTNSLDFFNRPVEIAKYSNTDYGYAPNMSATSKSKGFKYLEWYRFGLQFQNETGEWGSVVWIGDKQNLECYPNQINNNLSYYANIQNDSTINDIYSKFKSEDYNNISAIRYTPTDEIKSILYTFKNATKYRLVMAEHNNQTRTIKTQGFVMPTVFNLKQRSSKTCFGSPIWSYGALNNKQHLHNVDFSKSEGANYFMLNPTQQLDSALYKDVSDKDSEGNITNLKFSYLPTATAKTKKDPTSNAYLQKIDVIITVVRSTYDYILSHVVNNEFKGLNVTNFQRDKGGSITTPSVIQDFFQIRIIPYKGIYESNEVIKMDEFTISDYRFAGKRKNTFISLLSEIASKTWDDYESYTKEVLVDYMSGQIVNTEELPTADELRDASGAGADYTTSKTLPKHGSAVDKDLNTISEHSNEYFIDANLCNLWTPDIDNLTDGNYNIRLIGSVETLNTISDYDITVENNTIEGTTYTQADFDFNRFKWGQNLTDENNLYNIGVSSFLLWPGISHLMWVYPWNQQDYIQGVNFKLKSKTFGNFWKCNTEYVDYKNLIDYNKIRVYKSEEDITNMDLNLYYGKYQNLLFPLTNQRAFLNNESIVKDSAFEEIVSEIKKNNNTLVTIEEGSVGTRGTVNMKYSSTPHMVFELPVLGGYPDVLPKYEQSSSEFSEKNATVWGTVYPINSTIVDGYFKASIPNGAGSVLYALKEEIKENNKFKATILENNGSSYLQLVTDNLTITLEFWACENDGNGNSKVTNIPSKAPVIFYEDLGSINVNRVTFPALMLNDNGNVTFEEINSSSIFTDLNDYTSIKYTKSPYEKYNFWNSKTTKTTKEKTYYSDSLHRSNTKSNSFIAELYTKYDPATFMGGTAENALELNTFIPISDPTPIGEPIYGFEGDTYYQQWDCLRIYPTSEEDVNKIVDVVSVPIETYTNLDGDTRKARGRADVINIRPNNIMNQINSVYSQSNNYITANILDKKFEDSTHPLQYWWSLTKTPNSDIDTWTGVNLTSVAELDGDKGPLNKIKRWNNQLYTFQDKAIAMINFNNQTTIATQEGLPVEISNSGKVNGHYYITTNNGCKNKWSIVESPNGLYFIDSYNKSINLIGDGIKSLSQLNLFQDWIEQKERGNIWTPIRDIQAFKGFYDPIHKEVYFADGEDCICYNELLQQFTSFYDYQNMNYMFALDNHIYSIPTDSSLYTMFEGNDYCDLYGNQCDYYIQYKINNEPFIDKTWTNLEYRADIFKRGNIHNNEFATDDILSNETFDSLKVWNEYQNGELDLTKVRFNYLKDAKSKFRIWRTNLPRAKSTLSNKFGLDRIRNPWIMLELKKTGDTYNRMEFHDLIIKYVI